VKVRLAARTSVRNERFIEFVKGKVFVFIKEIFPCPPLIDSATAGLTSGEGALSWIQTSVSQNLAKNLAGLARSKITRELRVFPGHL
jgi:hypothetical protein